MDDVRIAQKYMNKVANSRQKGIEFTLSLTAFANMMRAKRCQLTGLPLTDETITVDRVDNSLGYVSGNVMAVHTVMNTMKGVIENPNNGLTFKNVAKAMRTIDKRLKS